MIKTLKVIYSFERNIEENLALEEYLMTLVNESEGILFMWSNKPCVVIGRNQNPWRECDIDYVKSSNITLARRKSGGGAVYQDQGNINMSIICCESEWNEEKQNSLWILLLKKLGIDAEVSGRNDICVQGMKCSGMAYSISRGKCLQHGTLMVDVDIKEMESCLTVSNTKLEAKGISSVRSRVTNIRKLSRLFEGLNCKDCIDQIREASFKTAKEIYKPERIFNLDTEYLLSCPEVEKRIHKYKSWEWNYGHRMQFTYQRELCTKDAEIQLSFNVRDGIVTECRIYTDSMDPEYAKIAEQSFIGIRFDQVDTEKIEHTIQKKT